MKETERLMITRTRIGEALGATAVAAVVCIGSAADGAIEVDAADLQEIIQTARILADATQSPDELASTIVLPELEGGAAHGNAAHGDTTAADRLPAASQAGGKTTAVVVRAALAEPGGSAGGEQPAPAAATVNAALNASDRGAIWEREPDAEAVSRSNVWVIAIAAAVWGAVMSGAAVGGMGLLWMWWRGRQVWDGR
jgi:hypothetical protein